MSEGLFRDLPCKAALVTAIYSVFVSMEVTGEALHFDEKFSYRYPLNAVLFHLLRMDEFRTEMLAIARSTHRAMAADQQPIYLKFVNILVNDGIRLLDDSLTQLRTLHQLEQEVASPDWAATPEDEKAEKLADMKKSVDLSTRLNLLSSDNVRLMEALTKLSSDVFVHQDMVDRMANMLDYFLEKVTGRERREYRVKESVQFQPRSLLQSLARIYANLSASTEFVQAIARDGRSYHAGLFEQAAATLAALGAAELEQQVVALAARVAEAAELEQQDTGLTQEAPEEFLDPILATLMREPVLLPSSGKVLDRSTIAKHLLTDQSDPFNRQPLVLAEVVPQAVLRARINAWLLEHQGSSSGQQPAAHGEEKQSVEELNSKESKPVADLDNTSAAQQAAAPARAYGVKVLPRIMRDLKQLRKEAPEDMMVVPDEADFTRIHVVLTGPADTPYEGGFFYFTLDCPPNYPEAPPKALIRTTDGGRVRFNPNLYREGKVCLSILGTWSGPGWTSALSLHSVLLSIQSLMNENPIRNEPGYDNLKDDDPKVKIYNEIIRHEVVRVAFLGMVLNPPSEMPDELHSWVLGRAPRHIAAQLEAVRRHKRLAGHRFDFFENKGVFRWDAMEAELLEVQQNM
jgi:ubiquitin-protein ligase